MKYNFEIDKNTCFVYWMQSLLEWNWFFNQNEYNYWKKIVGGFSNSEIKALKSIKKIIQKENNGYIWLWNKYLGKNILDKEDNKKYQEIKNVLKDKFELIWSIEYPKLLIWKNELEQYNFKDWENDFSKINSFFGGGLLDEINIKLLFYFGKIASGHAKKEFSNIIIIGLSNVDLARKDLVLKTIAHESVHLIEYLSDKEGVLKESYKKILSPLKIKQKQPSWRHLIIESVIYSIVGWGIGSFDAKIGYKRNYISSKKYEKTNAQKISSNIGYVAGDFVNLTNDYLNNNKEMDKYFCNQVASSWKDYILNKNID